MSLLVNSRLRLTVLIAALLLLAIAGTPFVEGQTSVPTSGPGSALSIPEPQLMQPEALTQLLHASQKEKPVIFQVGSHTLYTEAHIPGSTYAGPGSQTAGLQALRDKVSALPRKQLIVLYCGCCPWIHCPNVAPAFQQMRAMGFVNVKVLYLPNNFGTNWVSKGYPVE